MPELSWHPRCSPSTLHPLPASSWSVQIRNVIDANRASQCKSMSLMLMNLGGAGPRPSRRRQARRVHLDRCQPSQKVGCRCTLRPVRATARRAAESRENIQNVFRLCHAGQRMPGRGAAAAAPAQHRPAATNLTRCRQAGNRLACAGASVRPGRRCCRGGAAGSLSTRQQARQSTCLQPASLLASPAVAHCFAAGALLQAQSLQAACSTDMGLPLRAACG
jgi:hypothetical protein